MKTTDLLLVAGGFAVLAYVLHKTGAVQSVLPTVMRRDPTYQWQKPQSWDMQVDGYNQQENPFLAAYV